MINEQTTTDHMHYHIEYDEAKGKATVKLEVPNNIRDRALSTGAPTREKGDVIEFTSNDPDMAIYFKDGSAFNSHGCPEIILIGTGTTMLEVVKPPLLHGDCGRWNRDSQRFESWGGEGVEPPNSR